MLVNASSEEVERFADYGYDTYPVPQHTVHPLPMPLQISTQEGSVGSGGRAGGRPGSRGAPKQLGPGTGFWQDSLRCTISAAARALSPLALTPSSFDPSSSYVTKRRLCSAPGSERKSPPRARGPPPLQSPGSPYKVGPGRYSCECCVAFTNPNPDPCLGRAKPIG